jgi:ABC-type multidrug transport system fused ATPase/permease subunit
MQKEVSVSETIIPETFLPRISRQGRNYVNLVSWLLYQAFKGRTWKLALATGLSLLHLGSQAAAIYVVYWYGKQMEQTGLVTVPFVDIKVNLKEQPEWLWAIVVFSTISFVVSAILLYLSRKQILDMVEKYYSESLEQLVMLTLRVPDPRAPIASQIFHDRRLAGVTTGCRRGVLTSISFANTITSLVGGLGAAVFLFRIDLPLTLLIVGSGLLAAVFLYPLTLRGSKSAKEREKAQAMFRTEVRELQLAPTKERTSEGLVIADDLARIYMMRRRVLTELVFATEIGITILLGIVIYYMASQALSGKEQWAVFIAYIGALRLTLNGAAHAIRAFASVSRYYPQIVRYYLFLKDIQKIETTPLPEVHRGAKVMLGTLPNGKDVLAEIGGCLAILAVGQVREVMFALVHAKLAPSAGPVAAAEFDPADVSGSEAGIALVPSQALDKGGEQIRSLLEGALKNKLTLIIYNVADQVGSFGEKQVLTVKDGDLQRFAWLGTEEGDAVLKEFSLRAASKRGLKQDLAADEEDEDEDDM